MLAGSSGIKSSRRFCCTCRCRNGRPIPKSPVSASQPPKTEAFFPCGPGSATEPVEILQPCARAVLGSSVWRTSLRIRTNSDPPAPAGGNRGLGRVRNASVASSEYAARRSPRWLRCGGRGRPRSTPHTVDAVAHVGPILARSWPNRRRPRGKQRSTPSVEGSGRPLRARGIQGCQNSPRIGDDGLAGRVMSAILPFFNAECGHGAAKLEILLPSRHVPRGLTWREGSTFESCPPASPEQSMQGLELPTAFSWGGR